MANNEAKAYALDRILEHLEANANDPRKRERQRVAVAKRTIAKWLKEGEDVYRRPEVKDI